MPYIWGGETDRAGSWFGPQAMGGYDCSGFVWRSFKMTGNPAGRSIIGRTAAAMAGEIKRSSRIRLGKIRPADLVFFGPARFDSRVTASNITHVGIAMSSDFMIHSSSQGTYISRFLEPERRKRFSWARRVL